MKLPIIFFLTFLSLFISAPSLASNTSSESDSIDILIEPSENLIETKETDLTDEENKKFWHQYEKSFNSFSIDEKGNSIYDFNGEEWPLASPKTIHWQQLKELSVGERQSFIIRKTRYLSQCHRLLTLAKIPITKIQKTILNLNDQLFERMNLLKSSNNLIRKKNIIFTVGAGLGINSQLNQWIQKKFAGKSPLPKSGGFYFMFGLGASLYSFEGRTVLQFFADFDRLHSVQSFAGEVSASIHWGEGEELSGPLKSTQDLKSQYLGILGVLRESSDHFSYNLITGLALPPYLPVLMFYTNTTKRIHFSEIDITFIAKKISNIRRVFFRKGCQKIYYE